MQILFFAHLFKIWRQVQPQTLGLLSTDGAMEDLLLHFPLGYLDEDDHDDAYDDDHGGFASPFARRSSR